MTAALADAAASRTVLVVDDNLPNRLVAEAHLLAAGYRVVLAAGGREALELFPEVRPDLILLDILMPEMDGFETCRRLRELPGGADVPVAYLTALRDLETHARALETRADDLLTKPINRTELLMRVRSLLWMKQLRDDVRLQLDLIGAQNIELRDAHRARQEMISLIAHDLKNPLTAILLETGFLHRTPNVPERVKRALSSIEGSADHMHRMVLNLLDTVRSENGELPLRLDAVDPGQVVDEAITLMSRKAADRNQRIVRETSALLPRIVADRDMFRRILENLLDNCVKYTPSEGTVRVRTEVEGMDLLVHVIDEGPGIPESWRERIFDRYERLERDRGVRSGHGLGLRFCRLAAERHGGSIRVAENSPRGSVFTVRLPLGGPPS